MKKGTLSTETSDKFLHKKSLGQNFLTSPVVPNWMCDSALLETDDLVLEIGPGTGALTKVLLDRGAKVIAIEADERAVANLKENFITEINTGKLQLHHGDAREITPKTLGLKPYSFKVVANIPYYLSGFLLRLLLESDIQPKSLTFLIQKELAERIARDKKESILSLSIKVFGQPTYNKTVSKGHFYPKPKVDSAILSVHNIHLNNFQEFSREFFFKIIHLGLGNKRKQLLSNLSKEFDRTLLSNIFTKLSIPQNIRGEDLTLKTWLELINHLNKKPI